MRRLVVLVAGAALLAGCGSISSGQSTTNWLRQSNFAHTHHSLVGDVLSAERSLHLSSSSAPALHTVCGVLLFDTEAANASLPSPDHQANTLLALAYNTMAAGANTCYHAAGQPTQRATALRYLRQSLAQLSFAAIRLAVASTS